MSLGDALNRKKAQEVNASKAIATNTVCSGRVYCEGPSDEGGTIELTADVSFPSELAGEPHITLCPVMDITTSGTEIPEIYLVVLKFKRVRRVVADHYIGMTIGARITGNMNNNFVIHWSATAPGIIGGVPNG